MTLGLCLCHSVLRISAHLHRHTCRHFVVSAAERHARFVSARTVGMSELYDAKPDAARLFPTPIDFGYTPHTGPVHAVDCSPFHRNLFLSCGADGRLALFSMLQVGGRASRRLSHGFGCRLMLCACVSLCVLQSKPLTWFEPSSQYVASATVGLHCLYCHSR